ncbi:hypothetical protein [Tardiphaga sp. 841_E9_N1_2]|uniref:hypothetical protein n=1 Tax=Tardiphaga sp. 841_E9_N1_2 TaxID=3240762 RepID=UPI003F23C3C6
MLAQSFISAAELGITEPQRDALQKTLVLLETGHLRHVAIDALTEGDEYRFSGEFNMASFAFRHTCGTACCIGGTAQMVSGVRFSGCSRPDALETLFYPDQHTIPMSEITVPQAARALRSYLTTGDAKWAEAVA